MSTDSASIPTDTLSIGSAPSSPRNRVKFLCSHGGKILPRPADAHLKYVGGETRVISVPRDIPFQELMKKLTYLIDGEMILKYQVVSEDLDALVSVKSDEDLRHMFDEITQYENAGAPRLRAFLFPANPLLMENQMGNMDPRALEQRYLDAVNGVTRPLSLSIKQHPTFNNVQQGSLVSSACSSPRSPDSCTTEAMNNESVLHGMYQNNRLNMHRVQSSPSVYNMNIPPQSSQHIHQFSPHYYQNYRQSHQSGHQSPKPPIDHHKSIAPDRLISVRSVGRAEGVRYQMDPTSNYFYPVSRQNRGSGVYGNVHTDDCGQFLDRRMIDRNGNLVMHSVPSSPSRGHNGMKAWDNTVSGEM